MKQVALEGRNVSGDSSKRLASRRRRVHINVSVLVGGLVVIPVVLIAIFASVLAPHDPLAQDFEHLQTPPSQMYILGTDDLGRDILSRALYGARVSLSISALSTGLAVLIGLPLGLLTGYLRNWLDAVIMRLFDAILSFPGVLFAMLLVATLGPSTSAVVFALGLSYSPLFARSIRASTLIEREKEYVMAAVAVGGGLLHILKRHILPNIMHVFLVQGTLTLGLAVLSEATLSYLGLGPSPEIPSWGRMILEGRRTLEIAPHITIVPLIAVSLTVFGFNLLGNGLSDILDPRIRFGE